MIQESTSAKPWPTWHYLRSTLKPMQTAKPSSGGSTIDWIPYTLGGTALICALIVICCFCSAKCRGFFARLCCCCFYSRCRSNRGESVENTPRTSDKQSNTQSLSTSHSNSLDRVQIKGPAVQPSGYPSKGHMTNTLNTQKHIGALLTQSRRPLFQMYTTAPGSAPPAAKAVARTVKIIGDMLTYEGSRGKARKMVRG